MNILVCISKAPDTTSKIAFTNNLTQFDENGVQYIVNPYDEWYALVRALEIKESIGGNVTIVTVGTVSDEAVIRKALAIGADEAVRIDADPKDAFFVASQIASYAKSKGFDLVMTGKETINYNGSQVGGMIAESLDLPFISLATKLDANGSVLTLEREIVGGVQVVEVQLPAVVSCAKGMAEQRIPNMRGIMAARSKPLEIVAASASDKLTSITGFTLSKGRTDCKFIDASTPEKLIELLHTEAKAI